MADLSIRAYQRHLEQVRSRSTARVYAVGAKHFVSFMRSRRYLLASMPRGVMGEFAGWLVTKRFRPASVRSFVVGAQRYLDFRRDAGEQITATRTPDLPQVPVRRPQVLSTGEFRRYLTSAAGLGEPMRAVTLLLPYCGLRSAEMLGLRLTDVQVATVHGQQRISLRVVAGKGQKERLVPLLKQGYATFTTYLHGPRSKLGTRSDLLFPDGKGRRINERHLRRSLTAIAKAAQIAVTSHTLRRTYASTLHALGVPDSVLAEILGHASVNTTRRHYLAIDPNTIWASIDKAQQAQGAQP